jgi:signal transduction histidine kinase
MWKHVVLSAGIVAAIWLSSSLVTTTYLWWLEGSYEKSLQQNLASIDAAAALREDIWRLYASLDADSKGITLSISPTEVEARIRRHVERLDATAATSDERTLLGEIHDLIRAYYGSIHAPPESDGTTRQSTSGAVRGAFNLALQISAKADRISQIDHGSLEAAAERRLRIGSRIFWGRLIAILVGPVLGIMLGWWFSRRLVQTVAQIRVTLKGTSLEPDDELGTVRFRRKDELQFIREQTETVVERLRRTGSELQQARADILRSERLAAIGGLATGVAHEMRNPLTSVKLLLQHAGSNPGDAVLPQTKLRLILDEIGRMEGTIQGLLDFSRPPTLQCVRHDIRDTLKRAMNLVEGKAAAARVQLYPDLKNDPVTVDGDPQQLHQVFVNLLINGIEAMPNGGLLCVEVDVIESKSRVRVRIEDNGAGIPIDILPMLFEPFATSKERGTGLGLAISRRIVEEHGGAIEAFNRPEGGATFDVVLPCQITPTRSQQNEVAPSSVALDV